MEHFYQNIKGFSELHETGGLFDIILSKLPNRKLNICEIGIYMGRSCSIVNVILINKKIEYDYYGIDHFLGSIEHDNSIDYYSVTLENLKDLLENNKNIKIIKNDSILESSNYNDEFFDIVYIDASHDYESVKKDILAWLPKVKKDGIICGDDYINGWPGVVQAVNEIFGQEKVNHVGLQQWWVKKEEI